MAEGKISYNAEQVEAKIKPIKDFNSWYLSREEKIDRRVGFIIERLEYRLKNSTYLTRASREVDEIALSVLKRIKEAEYKPIKWAHESLDAAYNTRMTQKAQGLMYAKSSNLGRPYYAFVFPWDIGDIDPRGNIHESFGYGTKL